MVRGIKGRTKRGPLAGNELKMSLFVMNVTVVIRAAMVKISALVNKAAIVKRVEMVNSSQDLSCSVQCWKRVQ